MPLSACRSKQTPDAAFFFYNPLDGGTFQFVSDCGAYSSRVYTLAGILPFDADEDLLTAYQYFDHATGKVLTGYKRLKQAYFTDHEVGRKFIVSLNAAGQITISDFDDRHTPIRCNYAIRMAREVNKKGGSNKSYHTRKRGTRTDKHKLPKYRPFAQY